jgi:hypothetical protein
MVHRRLLDLSKRIETRRLWLSPISLAAKAELISDKQLLFDAVPFS